MTQRTELALAFLCGGTVGGVVVAAVLDQRLKRKYAQIADDEIEQVKEHYREKEMELLDEQKKIASQPKPSLEKMTEHLKDRAKAELIAEGEGYTGKSIEEAVEELRQQPQPDAEELGAEEIMPDWSYRDIWDQNREMAQRDKSIPYIIHAEEFNADDSYDHQVTLTYFEGDDVLVDEADEVITKKDEVVGLENLTKFGHGSGDPSVLYIRNDRLQQDMEILLHKSHYAKEVLGLEEEPEDLRHSAYRTRRFDDDDG